MPLTGQGMCWASAQGEDSFRTWSGSWPTTCQGAVLPTITVQVGPLLRRAATLARLTASYPAYVSRGRTSKGACQTGSWNASRAALHCPDPQVSPLGLAALGPAVLAQRVEGLVDRSTAHRNDHGIHRT